MKFREIGLRVSMAVWLAGAVGASCAPAQTVPPSDPPNGRAEHPNRRPPEKAAATVNVSVTTDKKVYRPNEAVKMTMSVKNPSKAPVILHFSSAQKYDFEIRRGHGAKAERVWRWSDGMMFAQALTSVTVDAGKSLTFTETYTPGGKLSSGKPAPALAAGDYSVTGTLTTMGASPKQTASSSFVVK